MVGFALALLLAAVPAAAQLYPKEWTPLAVSQWGGLNLLNDSTVIGTDAQKAQNVLTDNGYLEKRPGNVLLGTILSGYAVKYADDWVSPNGTRYLLAHSSNTIYQTDFSAAAVALGTVTASASVNSIAAFSRRYFADGTVVPWYWDGSSTATLVSVSGAYAPICTYMTLKDSRVFCANIPSEGRSRVRISSTGGAGYWVVPSDVSSVDNAANVFDFAPDDGDSIQCMATTPWGVFVGKRYSSWMIKGTGNLSYELRILDPKIGCADNRSVQMVNGVLQWLSVIGVYAYNGAGPPALISRELDPMLRGLAFATARSQEWRVDTQAEFEQGNLTASGPGAPISSTLEVGSITPSTWGATPSLSTATWQMSDVDTSAISTAFFDDFSDGDFSANPAWTAEYGSWDASSGRLGATAAGGSGRAIIRVGQSISTGTWAFNFVSSGPFANFALILASSNSLINLASPPSLFYGAGAMSVNVIQGSGDCTISIRQGGVSVPVTVVATANVGSGACTNSSTNTVRVSISTGGFATVWYNGTFSTAASFTNLSTHSVIAGILAAGMDTAGSFSMASFGGFRFPGFYENQVSLPYDTGFSTPIFGAYTVSMTSATSSSATFQTGGSATSGGTYAFTARANSSQPAGGLQFFRHKVIMAPPTSAVMVTTITGISLSAATSGYYHSPVHFVGSALTSYAQFVVTQNLPNGSTNTFSVRATTYSFTDASGIGIPWISQTANQTANVSVSTPAYFQWRVHMDFNQAENAPYVSRVAVNWEEGSASPVASGIQERRYFLCVTVSTTSTSNDTCIIRQQNGKWVTWTGPSIGSMGSYDNNLIVGDGSTSGKVWEAMQSGVYGDDGSTIDSQWVSADYTNGIIFNDKILHEFWVDAAPVSMSSVTLSYAVNKSSSYVDSEFYLDNGGGIDSTLTPTGIMQYGQINKWVPLADGFSVGKYFRVKFSDLTLSNYWRINSYLIYLENESRQVP